MTGTTAPGWVIGGSAYLTAAAGIDNAGDGWLRLTDLGLNEAGYAFLNSPFGIANGAVIQYDYVTWGGAGDIGGACPYTSTGADGYSIYLFDASEPFSVGASGGSLGYAQKTVAPEDPGLNYGYIGAGIDEYGNYSNPTEGRIGGPGPTCNAAAVRGPYNDPSGAYYYLGGTGSLSTQLSFPGQDYRPEQTGSQYRSVLIYLTPQPAPNYLSVDVYIQFGYGAPMTHVLSSLMVGRPVPANVMIGYAAATGSSNNYHEIRNLVVDPLPNSDIDLVMTKIVNSPSVAQGGGITYTLTATNNGPANVTANNAPIYDAVPSWINGVSWTCAAVNGASCGAASGSGNILNTTATLPINGTAIYTITGIVNASTPLGTQLTNQATITAPSGINDYNPSDGIANVTSTVVGAPISISGMVYNDNGQGGGIAHNGIKDGTEGTTGVTPIYAKLFLASNLTTALQVYTIGAAGTYAFTNVTSYENYTIIISSLNDTNFDPSPPNADWVGTGPSNYTLNVSAGVSNLTGENFGLWNGSRISGMVINDDGANGPTGPTTNANNGVLNAGETGIAGVTVQLTSNANPPNTVYDTEISNSVSSGNPVGYFALFTNTPTATLRIYQTVPTGYTTVNFNAGSNTGATSYTIVNATSAYISFPYTLYTLYNGVIFSDVQNNTFTPTPLTVNGPAGSPVYFSHTFTPGSGGTVAFTNSSNTQTWPVAYYQDTNCTGSYVGTDPLITNGTAYTASLGTPFCILVQVTIPPGAIANTTDVVVTQAQFTYTNSPGPIIVNSTVTDTATVKAGSNLSTSTKSWTDLDGSGDNPGDLLQFTIALNETDGVIANGVSVIDNLSSYLTNLTVTSYPSGALNNSTAGELDITNISVPASGSVQVVFRANIANGTAAGTLINNCAIINNPAGAGAAPCSSTITVSPSQIPSSGNKPMYIYNATAPYYMSRTQPAVSATTYATIAAGGSTTWTLNPALQLPVTVGIGNIVTYLWMATANNGNYTPTVTLLCGTNTVSTENSTAYALTGTTTQYIISLPPGQYYQCPAGSAFALQVTNNSANHTIQVYPAPGTSEYSYVNLPSSSVIFVNSVTPYSTPYPGTTQPASFTNTTVYERAVVGDPFGSYDIINSTSTPFNPTITITKPSGAIVVNAAAMPMVNNSGTAYKTFEYAYTPVANSPSGYYTASVTAKEGIENTVSDTGTGTFFLSPSFTILKYVQTYSDPVNGMTNPVSIPGACMIYNATVSNLSNGIADNNTVVLTDVIPANTSMCVQTIGNCTAISFGCASSTPSCGLTGTVAYSSQAGGGAPYNYTPSGNAQGVDANVTGVEITTTGTLYSNCSFGTVFKVLVR